MKTTLTSIALAVGLGASGSNAQSKCQTVLVPTYSPPSVAPGWTAQLVANGLLKPRSIQLDSSGALLVVESGKGVTRLTIKDGGWTYQKKKQTTHKKNQTKKKRARTRKRDKVAAPRSARPGAGDMTT